MLAQDFTLSKSFIRRLAMGLLNERTCGHCKHLSESITCGVCELTDHKVIYTEDNNFAENVNYTKISTDIMTKNNHPTRPVWLR